MKVSRGTAWLIGVVAGFVISLMFSCNCNNGEIKRWDTTCECVKTGMLPAVREPKDRN